MIPFNTQSANVQVFGLPVLDDHVLTSLDVDVARLLSTESLLRFARQLRGQFAIIINAGHEVSAVTDPMGSYPVYYNVAPGQSPHLSSCALDLAREAGARPSAEAIFSYAALGTNITTESFFAGVHKVPPGCILHASNRGQVRITPYFSWDEVLRIPETEWNIAKNMFREHFHSYVGPIVRHQRKAACLFSSGIDSALIVALLRREFPEADLRGYSVDYTTPFRSRYSEFIDALHNSRVLRLDLERVEATSSKCRRAFSDILSHSPDFPPADRALPIQFLSLLAAGGSRPTVYFTGFNADRPFCGHERWMDLSYKYSLAYNAAAPNLDAEGRARALGLPDPRRISTMKPLICAAGLSEKEFEAWVQDYEQKYITHLQRYEALDFLRLIQLLSEEEIGRLWADEHLLLEQLFGVRLVSPFGDIEMIKLGFALPLKSHFRDHKTKSFLRELLKEESGLMCEKRAFPSPMRFWIMSPSFFSSCGTGTVRKLRRAVWARNVTRFGRDYPLVYSFSALAAWLQKMSFC